MLRTRPCSARTRTQIHAQFGQLASRELHTEVSTLLLARLLLPVVLAGLMGCGSAEAATPTDAGTDGGGDVADSGLCGSELDEPDEANTDSDCDGIDGSKRAAVFVSPTGDDSHEGTTDRPLKTISAGMLLAKRLGRPQVLLATGTYAESTTLELIAGVSLYGGYDAKNGWIRTAEKTIVEGATVAIAAHNISERTTLARLEVRAQNAVSGTSVVLIAEKSPALRVVDKAMLVAGDGAAGAVGSDGESGATGGNGSPGLEGSADDEDKPGGGGRPGENLSCPTANSGAGGLGGQTPSYKGRDGAKSFGGLSGGVGSTPAGCTGKDGGRGSSAAETGKDGAAGLGGKGTVTDGTTGYPIGAPGLPGAPGTVGSGGGGGGGSSGQDGTFCNNGAGNGGGGGGAGGCGGQGGRGGRGGGGSVALILVDSPVELSTVTLATGKGGVGGSGGKGGSGGVGGKGAAGGERATSEVGRGGAGGDGKSAGAGGVGGGGSGGPTVGIWLIGPPPKQTAVTFTLGMPGAGGGGSGSAGESREVAP